MKRPHISLKTKVASLLVEKFKIPHEHAKEMTEAQVLSLAHWDHYPIRFEDGGPATHWNLEARLIADHREKTAKKDIPAIAKGKRIRALEAQHRAIMAGEPIERKRHKRKIQSRGFPPKGSRTFRRISK